MQSGKFIAIRAYILKKERDNSKKQPNDAPYAPRKTRANQIQNQQTERNNKDLG
jgi:hypothetical protein